MYKGDKKNNAGKRVVAFPTRVGIYGDDLVSFQANKVLECCAVLLIVRNCTWFGRTAKKCAVPPLMSNPPVKTQHRAPFIKI